MPALAEARSRFDITRRNKLEERVNRLQTLVALTRLTSSSLDMDGVLTGIAQAASRLLDAPFVSVLVVDEAAGALEARAFSDHALGAEYPTRRLSFDEGAAGWVVRHRELLDVADVYAEDSPIVPHAWWQMHGFSSYCGVPILLDGAFLGILALIGCRPFAFEPDEKDLIEGFVAQAAVAIRNAALYAKVAAANAELDQALRRNELALNSAGEGICGIDRTGHAIFVNPAAAHMTGYTVGELTGTPLHDLLHGPAAGEAAHAWPACPIYAAVRDGEVWRASDLRFVRKDGSRFPVDVVGTPMADAAGGVTGVVLSFQDISDRLSLEEQLERRAHYDSLTGLPNRALFIDRLQHALKARERRPGGVAVLFMDLDGFKKVNDSLGHPAGDALLQDAAQRIAGCLRAGDSVARFGGDEFAVILEEVSDDEAARRLAARIIARLGEPFTLAQREVYVGASIGIALCAGPDAAATPEELMKQADIALYRAKDAGKGCAALFAPEMSDWAIGSLKLEAGLRRAIDRDELRLLYQPEIDLTTGAITSIEALVRWEHPEAGLLCPERFILLAEATGLIGPLGAWVLAEACRQAQSWRERCPAAAWSINVNLSARQIESPEIVEHVGAALAASGLDPRALRLEIAERALREDADGATDSLRGLVALGVRLAIDNFGAGCSSLSYLRHVPADTLKVDRSLIAALPVDPPTVAIVQAMASLAAALNTRLTAEGIETPEELAAAHGAGCERGSGYLFAPAVSAREMSAYLVAGRFALPEPAGNIRRQPLRRRICVR